MISPIPADRSPSCVVALFLLAILALWNAGARAQDQPTAGPPSAQGQQPAPPPGASSTTEPANPAPAKPEPAKPATTNPASTNQAPSNPAAGNAGPTEGGNPAPASVQTAPPPPAPAAPGAVETPAVVVEGATDTILGKPIVSASGDDMGRIVDVMVDHKGMVRAAIIDFGGFLGVGTRKIAVDWRALHFPKSGAMDKIVAELSQDQLRAAPAYKPGEPVVIIGSTDATPQPNPANPATPAVPAATGSMPTQPASPSSPAAVAPAPPPSTPAPATSAPLSPAPSNTAPAQSNAPAQNP